MAKATPKKQTAGLRGSSAQVETLGALSQKAAAWLVSITTRALRDAADLPRNPDGTYNGRDLVKWAEERATSKVQGELDALVGAGSKVSTSSLETYRDERARMARLERLERENKLIPRDEVHQALVRLAAILRGAGELLGRDHGEAAVRILNDALKAFEAEIASNDVLRGAAETDSCQ